MKNGVHDAVKLFLMLASNGLGISLLEPEDEAVAKAAVEVVVVVESVRG